MDENPGGALGDAQRLGHLSATQSHPIGEKQGCTLSLGKGVEGPFDRVDLGVVGFVGLGQVETIRRRGTTGLTSNVIQEDCPGDGEEPSPGLPPRYPPNARVALMNVSCIRSSASVLSRHRETRYA